MSDGFQLVYQLCMNYYVAWAEGCWRRSSFKKCFRLYCSCLQFMIFIKFPFSCIHLTECYQKALRWLCFISLACFKSRHSTHSVIVETYISLIPNICNRICKHKYSLYCYMAFRKLKLIITRVLQVNLSNLHTSMKRNRTVTKKQINWERYRMCLG